MATMGFMISYPRLEWKQIIGLLSMIFFISSHSFGQVTLRGTLTDAATGETLIGASVSVEGTSIGTITDYDGRFELDYPKNPPFTMVFNFLGFAAQRREITAANVGENMKIKMETEAFETGVIEIIESRITEKTKEDPRTIESLDAISIKETTAANFYNGLGNLKGVDLTTASLGFTIINTRGFNSTSPVRSLQIIDGVDNQAPGLNFSLGNFLGSPELDVQKVDLVVGANSAYFGPNAFNGVISMQTKSPFIQQGLSVMVKAGERNLLETGLRYAKAFKNKNGKEKFAFKINASYLMANDWEAENYDEVYKEDPNDYIGTDNPGGYDAVNIYGDEHGSEAFDHRSIGLTKDFPGLGDIYRKGYKEIDLVDYDTRNIKAGAALHYKIMPSTELILSHSFGNGTTVYQGENRFSLKNIRFNQTRAEINKPDKYFIRAYYTRENDGDTYDAYFTAQRLLEYSKDNVQWLQDYRNLWKNANTLNQDLEWNYNFVDSVRAWPGWPVVSLGVPFDLELANTILAEHYDLLVQYHQITQEAANNYVQYLSGDHPYLVPGTPEFDDIFNQITTSYDRDAKFSDGVIPGTGFYDQSALWHAHGEYKFTPSFADLTVGGNFRQYLPNSKGTIFNDKEEKIINNEVGSYLGFEKKIFKNKVKLNATLRADKNQNFPVLLSPALSAVYTLDENNILRLALSSAIRNPTLSDQYLNYNVGPATLIGNIDGVDSLVTVESFFDFLDSKIPDTLDYFNVAPIVPEKVKSIEIGYRTTLSNKIYVDGSYYFSYYTDFIGYILGIAMKYDSLNIVKEYRPYRVSTNSTKNVTTQGFSIAANYYFYKNIAFAGNYAWNRLNTKTDDPIIPAFNTPEHKFNVGFNGRDMVLRMGQKKWQNWGFNINYRWIQGFLFQGSPQYTGLIPSYGSLDGQINWMVTKAKTTIKVGCTNMLNEKNFQVYGGPRVGRLAYISAVVELK